mgnify:CR=1 FL=1
MSVVTDVYQLIKDLIEEAKKTKNDSMVRQLIDIKLALSDLQDENKKLKEQLEQQEQIVRHSDGNYITLKDDELHIQYCSTCWGKEKMLIQLNEEDNDSGLPRCPICFNNWLKARNGSK